MGNKVVRLGANAKTVDDTDGALNRITTRAPSTKPPLNNKNTDITFGLHGKQDGQLGMGNKVIRLDVNRKT